MKIQLLNDIKLLENRKARIQLRIKLYENELKEMQEQLNVIDKRIEITKQIIGDDTNDRFNNIEKFTD